MKHFLLITTAFLLVFLSCKDKEENTNPGKVEFSFNIPVSKLKSFNQSDSSDIAFALVTIQDKNGNYVFNMKKLSLYKMGESYITEPLSFNPGDYNLTGFLISNSSNIVTYASPQTGSQLSYLVEAPLPLNFSLRSDKVVKISPEVLDSRDVNPLEFGYATFSFDIVNTFKIYVSTFEYVSWLQNYQLTDASLKVTFQNDSSEIILPLSSTTNYITLPEKQTVYTLTASKDSKSPVSFSFTLDSLKTFQTKPLMFIFGQDENPLVAHYLLNGNTLDYSGHGNHGTLYGAVPISRNNDSTYFAYRFDGFDDYVRVANSPSLNPKDQITVAAWYKTTSFVGSGNDGLVSKGYTSHVDPYYQYNLGVCGDSYWNGQSGFGFSLSLDNQYKGVSTGSNFYKTNEWYHIVGTYDGNYIKIYVNGSLINSQRATGSMTDFGQDLYIARHGNKSEYYNTIFHLPGDIDDVRIYSKALTADQILNMYQNSK